MPQKKSSKKKSAKKVDKTALPNSRVKLSFRKHFLPPLAGLLVAVLVFGFFNSEYLSSQIAYYLSQKRLSQSTQSIVIDPKIDKNAPPKIIINKINVNAPVIFDNTTVNEAAFQQSLKKGVVHYPQTANPGQPGNVVIFGHSSGQWWAPGNYKFVFTLLDKLQFDDKIILDYQGVRYIYRVNNISTVSPNDMSVLNQGANKTLTLITCTPVGTSSKRLIIRAQQIVPISAPNTQATSSAKPPADVPNKLPSNRPSFWQSLRELIQ